MLKKIAYIAILLTSMSAVADKNNGVGVDTQMRYYVLNGEYKCLVYPLQKEGEQALGMGMLGGAALIISGSESNKKIAMQIVTNSGEETKILSMPSLRLYKAGSTLTSYTPIDKKFSSNRTYSLIAKADQIAYAINQGDGGMNIVITNCKEMED